MKPFFWFALISPLFLALPPAHAARPLNFQEKVDQLMDRLSFGPRPGEYEKLLKSGPEGLKAWIENQLNPDRIDDKDLEDKLASMPSLKMNQAELWQNFADFDERIKKMGLDPKSVKSNEDEKKELRKKIGEDHLPDKIYQDLVAQKLIRAVESRRQLEEVLVDFWFNHFNVDSSKGDVRYMMTAYERDVIRPHLFGKFRDLLSATAHSPAMLFYLDNHLSSGGAKGPGLNENYGRELLELHTLGVDGGYTQNDVRELARVLTGWSVDKPKQDAKFVFKEKQHDPGEKTVLGQHFAPGGGQNEGETMLEVISRSPVTAKYISTLLVRYFVSDHPSPALINRITKTYLASDGDLKKVYRAIFASPEFWARENFHAKIKTPFEYLVSAIRALGGELEVKNQLPQLLNQMGEPLYRCQPPTGYKNDAASWVNPGALVERLNFGLQLAANRINGVYTQLPVLKISPKIAEKHPEVLVKEIELKLLHAPLSPASRKVVLSEFERDGRIMADGEVRPLSVAKAAGLVLGSPEFQRR
jgi:uncharacterized protein (DUF1800 family)